jgi:hypothetical protein
MFVQSAHNPASFFLTGGPQRCWPTAGGGVIFHKAQDGHRYRILFIKRLKKHKITASRWMAQT